MMETDALEEVIRVGDHFYVHASSSRADDRTRVLKHGETFGVFDRRGDIQPVGLGEQGVYHEGTRFCSRLEFRLGSVRPLLLGSTVDDDNIVLSVDLTNPDMADLCQTKVLRGTIHVLRMRMLWEGVVFERICVRNYGRQTLNLRPVLLFDADFADMFEIRGIPRERHGRRYPPTVAPCGVELVYLGLDDVSRTLRLSCIPEPFRVTADRIEFDAQVEAGHQAELELHLECLSGSQRPPAQARYAQALSSAEKRVDQLRKSHCEIDTSNEQFNDWLNRSWSDLRLMITETPEGPYPYAGIPWFSTPFGRDGIITALQTLWVAPQIARGVLSYLAVTQAESTDARFDAEPGKIVHEVRHGEMVTTGEVPYARYYGSADATPLFVLLAGEYFHATADRDFVTRLWPHVRRAMAWIDEYGDRDGDGFVEYQCSARGGLHNQGWKDSGDSVFHRDGTLAAPPIALCEVQAYVYGAWSLAGEMADLVGDSGFGSECRGKAERLKARFDDCFWDESLGLYALALDGRKTPCQVPTSNAGQCLFTGIADQRHAIRCVNAMMTPEMFSGWGIRTLATSAACYNPMSYHNGSVWPHDNSLIALGMARVGDRDAVGRVLSAMMDVSVLADLHRLPELFCGFERRRGEGPVGYPMACAPQAWAAGAGFLLLQASLGIEPRADRDELRLNTPRLPDFLQTVRLRNLRVGQCSVDLTLRRQPNDVGVEIDRKTSSIRVVVTH